MVLVQAMAKVLATVSIVALTVLAGFGLFRSGVIDGVMGNTKGAGAHFAIFVALSFRS